MGKYPMAQATLSCPFGAIHLEDRRETAQDGHFVSIFALPPSPPLRGTRTCWILQHFQRTKSEWLVSIPAGPLGPGRMENCGGCNSTAAPSLAEQVIAGPSSSGRSGTGPYERRDSFCIRRRGGCPHPPVPSPWEPTPLMGRIIISLKGTAGKIRRRNAVSHKVLLVTFLPRKVTPPPGCSRC